LDLSKSIAKTLENLTHVQNGSKK